MNQLFKNVFDSPDRKENEHPYEYINRVYNHGVNSWLSGLPGYSPPAHITAINYLIVFSMIYTVIALFSLLASTVISVFVRFVTWSTNLEVLINIPLSGIELISFELLSFTLYTSIPMIMLYAFSAGVIITIISLRLYEYGEPYEEEYESWLSEVQPANHGYPSEFIMINMDDDVSIPDAPSSAPPAFRDMRLSEKIATLIRNWLIFTVVMTTTVWAPYEKILDD